MCEKRPSGGSNNGWVEGEHNSPKRQAFTQPLMYNKIISQISN
jgi:hypothetical protein